MFIKRRLLFSATVCALFALTSLGIAEKATNSKKRVSKRINVTKKVAPKRGQASDPSALGRNVVRAIVFSNGPVADKLNGGKRITSKQLLTSLGLARGQNLKKQIRAIKNPAHRKAMQRIYSKAGNNDQKFLKRIKNNFQARANQKTIRQTLDRLADKLPKDFYQRLGQQIHAGQRPAILASMKTLQALLEKIKAGAYGAPDNSKESVGAYVVVDNMMDIVYVLIVPVAVANADVDDSKPTQIAKRMPVFVDNLVKGYRIKAAKK